MAQDAGINLSQPHVDAAVVSHKQPTKVHPPTRDTHGVSGRISGHPVLRANPSALASHRAASFCSRKWHLITQPPGSK